MGSRRIAVGQHIDIAAGIVARSAVEVLQGGDIERTEGLISVGREGVGADGGAIVEAHSHIVVGHDRIDVLVEPVIARVIR